MSPTNPKNPAPQANRHNAQQDLRTRAVLHEGKLRDRHARRPRKHPPFCLMPDVAEVLTDLAEHLDAHDGWPPNVSRSAAPAIRTAHGMRDSYGPLALVRFSAPHLDALPLESDELRDEGKADFAARLSKVTVLPINLVPHLAAVQRKAGTHEHGILPACFLADEYRESIMAAPHGIGGGCEWPDVAGHGVIIKDTVQDREKVGAYIRRHPDSRLDTPGTLEYLLAMNEEAQRKHNGVRLPKLAWDGGKARYL